MSKSLYFLGIGGTLMGSLAILAQEAGYTVRGSDTAVYPPMSDLLAAADIEVFEGFKEEHLQPEPDLVIVGNANLPRGHPAIEYVLERGLPYTSGAEWLGQEILAQRWVIAVAGTHGKTTTASMLAWILEFAGLEPGYLIGGAPNNFGRSARLGNTPFFVVEADEYDTSYFDRRSKFVHYAPRTLVINNLEYDHADIFPDLAAIQAQFHLLLRTVPGNGLVVAPELDDAVNQVLKQGCWTPVSRVNPTLRDAAARNHVASDTGEIWHANDATHDGREFNVCMNDEDYGRVTWHLLGEHNVANALAAVAAARHAGVPAAIAVSALREFKGVKRRMELIATVGNNRIYDDFAHHPTAIRTTLQGLRNAVGGGEEIVAIIEPRTHTMSLGALQDELKTCCAPADQVLWFRGPNIKWDIFSVASECVVPATVDDNIDSLIERIAKLPDKPRHIVIMSNGSFQGIYQQLPERLRAL